jgi:predicted O-methyltransferase YrrM
MEEYVEVTKRFEEQKTKINRLWNIGQDTAELLKMLVLIKQPSIVLELGTSNGYSTFHIAQSLLETAVLYTVDVEAARQDLAKENLKHFENIVFINQRIEDYIPQIKYQIDFLFIDANKLNYLKYLLALEVKLSNGAVIIADNINSHEGNIEEYTEYITRSKDKYTSIKLDIDSGIWISHYHEPERLDIKRS